MKLKEGKTFLVHKDLLIVLPLAPWDPVGIPLNPLGPSRPTPLPPGTLEAYPLTPWDPRGLSLDPESESRINSWT